MLPVWSRSPTFARGPRTTTSGPVVTMPHTVLTCAAAADGGVFQVQEIIISRQAPVRMCVWYSVCVWVFLLLLSSNVSRCDANFISCTLRDIYL